MRILSIGGVDKINHLVANPINLSSIDFSAYLKTCKTTNASVVKTVNVCGSGNSGLFSGIHTAYSVQLLWVSLWFGYSLDSSAHKVLETLGSLPLSISRNLSILRGIFTVHDTSCYCLLCVVGFLFLKFFFLVYGLSSLWKFKGFWKLRFSSKSTVIIVWGCRNFVFWTLLLHLLWFGEILGRNFHYSNYS